MVSPPVDRARLSAILAGAAKPANESEASAAAWAVMWKKTFEEALRPMAEPEGDSLSSSYSQAARDRQATMMGVEAASALAASLQSQLSHKRPGSA